MGNIDFFFRGLNACLGIDLDIGLDTCQVDASRVRSHLIYVVLQGWMLFSLADLCVLRFSVRWLYDQIGLTIRFMFGLNLGIRHGELLGHRRLNSLASNISGRRAPERLI